MRNKQVGDPVIEEKPIGIIQKKKILIIDDEASTTRALKETLEKTGGYEIREENDSTKGVETAREFMPDLILLDMAMPHMDGGEVAFRIQSDEKLKDIPIVFLTAMIRKEEEGIKSRVSWAYGGRPFIKKPVTREQLIDAIEKNIAKL